MENFKISLCMIVKNEANVLDRCLKSVNGIVDEIIILDSGSDDETKTIASKYGAEIYDFTWIDDFSAARNEALDKAKYNWILHLDADEEIDELHKNSIKEIIKNNQVDGFFIGVRNFAAKGSFEKYTEDLQVRLFRNKPEFRYQNRIHEQIGNSIEQNRGIVLKSEIIINHYGYMEKNIEKAQRNLPIILKAIEENPDDSYINFKLGETYKVLDDINNSKKHLLLALSINDKRKQLPVNILDIIFMRLAQIGLGENNYKEALEYAQNSISYNKNNDISKYIYAISCTYLGQIEIAYNAFKKLLESETDAIDLKDIEKLLIALEQAAPQLKY